MRRATADACVEVRRATNGAVLARADVARRPLSRMRGLLGRASLNEGSGLVIERCSSVHTCFMRFPIDVVFLSAEGTVLRTAERVVPFRFVSGGWRAVRTVELPAGTIDRSRIVPGEELVMVAL